LALKRTKEQQDILDAQEQTILVTARPGRGKTTVAILLAECIIRDKQINSSQQVLFLTFSRNAVYQIEQASGQILDTEIKNRLWIANYHSFMWWTLSVFGRFHGLPRKLGVMGKTKAKAARMAASRANVEKDQLGFFFARTLLAISYDDFAPLTLALLRNSDNVCAMIRHRFPVVLVDEFQDTNAEQWELVKIIAEGSRLVCFADPDQMIYRWRGASGDRLNQLLNERQAKLYPLQQKCLRTDEHDLLDFAEAILDDKPGSARERAMRKRRFLMAYPGRNALGYYLKMVIREFYSDFQKRDVQVRFPSIAIAAYSNGDAKAIQDALGRSTEKAPKTYRCSLLEGDVDDVLDELLIHLAAWAAGDERKELEQAIQLIGGMLTSDISKASGPIASLFAPKDLLDGRTQPRATAKHVIELFESVQSPLITTGREAIAQAADATNRLRVCVKAACKVIPENDLQARQAEMLRIIESAPTGSALSVVQYLRDKLAAERLRRDVLERVTPVRGIVSSTLHKLKGREFDYVCVVTRSGDRLRGTNEDESDARRLMYVALTRARYDARILYVGSNPCFLLNSYLQT
jgi:DNA helicase-2/ATP-dependent DNA helicase PcrA